MSGKAKEKTGVRKLWSIVRSIDYRHYLCGVITLAFVACWGLFPNALGRVIESVRDLCLSVPYFICEFLGIEHTISPTVNKLPKIPFFDFSQPSGGGGSSNASPPAVFIPRDWAIFKSKWVTYWRTWANWRNLLRYLVYVVYGFILAVQVLFLLGILLYFLRRKLKKYLENQNNNYDKDSKGVRIHRKISFYFYLPVKWWITNFIRFLRENTFWWKIWLCIWAFYFNVFTIVLELVAYAFYLIGSFNFGSLYRQLYKLCIDLHTPLTFIPVWAWVIVAFVVFDKFRKSRGYDNLNHMERRNCGFTNARSIVSLLVASMGMGKTTMGVDQCLSNSVEHRRIAFEKILENDLKFPHFPWIRLEKALQRAMAAHTVYNLATIRRFIQRRKAYFEKHPSRRNCFWYDYEHYGFTYDDKLKVVTVWDIIETYAQLYFIYIIETANIANLSIRLDDILNDVGNFPRWNSDFFKKDSRLMGAFSRHAKIIDFNALRLGMKLGSDRRFADSFEFGTVFISEGGKERGNKVENAGKRKDSATANQLNDGFNLWLKMIRHSATVDGYSFVRVIMDEQRPESLGADARELCEIVHIRDKSEKRLAMPFFALTELLYVFVFNKFAELYYQYRFYRSDNTLPMLWLKIFVAKIEHYYKGIYNTFGYHVLHVEVERGTQDGEMRKAEYYIMDKKIYSKRFSTDCFSDFFTVKALRSPVGLADMPEYETEKASFAEMKMQNSYFFNDLYDGLFNEYMNFD